MTDDFNVEVDVKAIQNKVANMTQIWKHVNDFNKSDKHSGVNVDLELHQGSYYHMYLCWRDDTALDDAERERAKAKLQSLPTGVPRTKNGW